MIKKVCVSCFIFSLVAFHAFALEDFDLDDAEIAELIESVDLADVEDLDDEMLDELLALEFDEDDSEEGDFYDSITAHQGFEEEIEDFS